MKPKPFMISVQWGAGYHYFLRGEDTEAAALVRRDHLQRQEDDNHKRRGGRGAKPTVYAWKCLGVGK